MVSESSCRTLPIIECDSTLYVGMTRKQNGGPIPRIHCSFAKSRLWTGIKPKRTFRSHFRLVLEIKQLLTSKKKVVEVANRRNKRSNFRTSSSSFLHIFQQSYRSICWSYGANFNTSDLNFLARSAFSYSCYDCTTYGACGISGTIRRLPHSNTPSCSMKNIRLLHNHESRWLSE